MTKMRQQSYKKKIQIAEVTPVYPPYKGGMGMVCVENAKMFSELGYETVVYSPYYASLKTSTGYDDMHNGVRIRRLRPFFEYGNAAVIPQLAWYVRNADIIHLHYPFLDAASPILLAIALWKKKKLIITYHMDLIGNGMRAIIFHLYTAFMLPLVARRADAIFVTSFDYARHSQLKPYLEKYLKKIHEIPCCIDTDHFIPKDKNQKYRQLYSLKNDERVILFVGGLDSAHYFKGVELLISAVAALPSQIEWRLIIVGDGDLRSRYEQYAKNAEVSERAVFAGLVSNELLPDYYNLADCLVLPSVDSSEAFGNVLIEAGGCGKPVIASSLPGVRSVVDHGVSGLLIKSNSVIELTKALTEILSDDKKAYQMGQKGFEKVQKRYSSRAVKEKLSSIMTSLIEVNQEL